MRRKSTTRRPGQGFNTIHFLIVTFAVFGLVIIARLFYLQILRGDFYTTVAARAHQGYTELPAKRGEILVQDYTTGEFYTVAANTTMDFVYVDPKLIPNKTLAATAISESLFDVAIEREKDNQRVVEERREYKRTGDIEAYDRVQPLADEELKETFYHEVLDKVSRDIRPKILLSSNLPDDVLAGISEYNLAGIEVKGGSLMAYPSQVYDKRRVARELSEILEIPAPRLEQILIGENRYEIIMKKVEPGKSRILHEIIANDMDEYPEAGHFLGVGFREEYYRYYPEQKMAANLLGFVDKDGKGQYGIEETFDAQLKGKAGVFKAKIDSIGRQITVGESIIQPAVDGQDILLTIDRTVQLEVERILKASVEKYRANAGQVVVIDPQTSKVIAMAHYPTFDPNNYSEAFDLVDVDFTAEEIESLLPVDEESDDSFYFYRNWDTHDRYEVFKDTEEGKAPVFQRYVNFFGAEVYQNKIVASIYEPGSVFKSITMVSAIDDGDVTPNHTFYESGPIEVDEFEIHNSTDDYRGLQTMTNVLEQSSNVGMAYVAKKIGRNLFYNYMLRFGFGERTGIEFDHEQSGHIEYFTEWADSELVTHAFGQGIAVTPLQMANAYAALANGGVLMQPYIVAATRDADGQTHYTEPLIINQAISKESADTITAMLKSAVENGVANKAQVDGYCIAGKTGTSQTYKHGQPLHGPGTTITSFGGYGPTDDPRFVILVKLDNPRTSEWGAETAAPVFKDIATFLFSYYNIPPDK